MTKQKITVEDAIAVVVEAAQHTPERVNVALGPIRLSPAAEFAMCPPETRLSVGQLAAALNRPRSWVYRRTSKKSGLPQLPHRRFVGGLSFVVGEVRAYIEANEQRHG